MGACLDGMEWLTTWKLVFVGGRVSSVNTSWFNGSHLLATVYFTPQYIHVLYSISLSNTAKEFIDQGSIQCFLYHRSTDQPFPFIFFLLMF